MNIGEMYLMPLYQYYKKLGGKKSRDEFMVFINSEKFDAVLLEAI